MDWLERIRTWLAAGTPAGLFHRRVRLSSEAVAWLRDPARSESDCRAFATMLLRLDADPTKDTVPILRANAPAGMRWARFDGHTAIFVFDIPANQITIVSCI